MSINWRLFMNKYYLSLSTTFLLLFTGCNSNNALNHFKKNPESARAIQYTKKADLVYNNEINSMIFSTYLNKVNKKYESNKVNNFVVGIHLVNKNEHDFIKNDYFITLNDKKPLNIIKIDENSELVSSIPLKNNWANYYLLEFENDENQNMNIIFSHPTFGKTKIGFQK